MNKEIKVLDHGYVRLVEAWGGGDAFDVIRHPDYEAGIIEAARQSTQGSFRGWDQDQKLLDFLFKHKHATPFEFAGMVIEVKAPIAVFREWHRHRTQAYNEMSARYAPLPDVHYLPTPERCLLVQPGNKQAEAVKDAPVLTHAAALQWLSRLQQAYELTQAVYTEGLALGVPKELARGSNVVFRYSQMRATCSLRNWLAFLTLRMDPAAQWEIRQFANAVGELVAEKFPRTWDLFQGR